MSNFDATSYPKDKIKVLFLENISDKAVQYFKDMGYTDVKKVAVYIFLGIGQLVHDLITTERFICHPAA